VEQKKKSDPVNAEINGREVDFKNISTEEALHILEVLLLLALQSHHKCLSQCGHPCLRWASIA
jgi:hypothetical protein